MLVNQINASPEVNQNEKKNAPNTLDEHDFYQLLITQLQNQDPLDPLKPDDFIAQLSQFAQLEAMHNMEDQTKLLANYQASMNNLLALNLLGKEVKAKGDVIHLKESAQPNLYYSLNRDAAQVVIKIYDRNGTLVRTVDMGEQSEGEYTISWDGRDDTGHLLPPGEYTFSVVAITADGASVGADTYISGKVIGAEFNNEHVYLKLEDSNQMIELSQILTINEFSQE